MLDAAFTIDDLDMELKPARRYIARSVQLQGGGFRAQWAAPGMIPDWVYFGDGPELFRDAESAEAKARMVLFDALNSRRRQTGKNVKHGRMTGPEFAVALAEAEISPSEFAILWGAKNQDRVIEWIDGAADIPFMVRPMIELLKDKRNLETVRRIVAEHTTEKP